MFECQEIPVLEFNNDVFIPSKKAWTALSTQFSKCCNTSTISLLLLLGTTALTALICKTRGHSTRGTGFFKVTQVDKINVQWRCFKMYITFALRTEIYGSLYDKFKYVKPNILRVCLTANRERSVEKLQWNSQVQHIKATLLKQYSTSLHSIVSVRENILIMKNKTYDYWFQNKPTYS